MNCASLGKDTLITVGKLAASGCAIRHESAVPVDGRIGGKWKVTFRDGAASGKSKEARCMFFTATGSFIAANCTGP